MSPATSARSIVWSAVCQAGGAGFWSATTCRAGASPTRAEDIEKISTAAASKESGAVRAIVVAIISGLLCVSPPMRCRPIIDLPLDNAISDNAISPGKARTT